jgi:hypothetical protein
MAHGDATGDVVFDGATVHFRCHCRSLYAVPLASVRLVTLDPAHTLPAWRANWTLDLGACRCGIHHFLNANLPATHPHPNAPIIEALIVAKGMVAVAVTTGGTTS